MRDVGLQQKVDFGAGFLDALFYGNGHEVHELLQFQFLLLSDGDVAEFGRKRKDAEELNVTEGRLKQLIVGGHTGVRTVVVASNAAQLRALKVARFTVVLDQVRLVQNDSRRMNQVGSVALEQRVVLGRQSLGRYAVELRLTQHSDVEIRVAEPINGISHALHRA